MPSNIVLWDPASIADPDGRIDFRYENTQSTPIASASALENGQEISDVYELTFTNLGGGSFSVDVVAGAGSKNPNHATGVACVCDGATPNYDIIGGVALVFSASTDTGWKAKVAIGAIMTGAGATTDVLNRGIVDAGTSSTEKQIAAKNVGDAASATTHIRAVPGFYWTPWDRRDIVLLIDNHTDDTLEHNAGKGTYEITFTDWGDDAVTGFKKCNLYVAKDGGAPVLAVTNAQFDGATRYQYGHADYNDTDDPLEGLSIILQNTSADPSAYTITLAVIDGWQWEELAEDLTGSPGSYGTGDLTLTQSGETSGVVQDGGNAKFWSRWNLPDDAEPDAIRTNRFSIRGRTI